VERALVLAMARLGLEWAQGLLSAEVVASAGRTAEYVADLLAPPPAQPAPGAARVAVVAMEDQHTIGKRLVLAHLAGAGYEGLDLGVASSPEAAAREARERGASVLLVSASMVRSALRIRELTALLRQGPALPVGVGGAAFRLDEALWSAVGADGAATAAHEAPALVARLLATRS
jgi:methanogenic corrinoid protein MtbC1